MNELLAAGHTTVLGLARSDSAAAAMAALGVDVHRGSLEEPESFAAGAAASGGIIHTAFNHDFSRFVDNAAAEFKASQPWAKCSRERKRPLIAEVIGRRVGLPVVSMSREEAADHFGFLGHFFGLDIPASSAKTRERLGWQLTGPGLIEDIDREAYFPRTAA
ncbi:hypothetical protein RKE25_16180 [Dyella sp. BiH032]|uniref:hypothetical protein n=1 Tax=Dyella sp. BiH032 TaxID=3075430 RepID=UPI002892A02B|nr:hypothetical protein [Dyella sp. BiH032]WNL44947.1 hypothetical protein RKE25_16180 [Dyella sp. BiH032]